MHIECVTNNCNRGNPYRDDRQEFDCARGFDGTIRSINELKIKQEPKAPVFLKEIPVSPE